MRKGLLRQDEEFIEMQDIRPQVQDCSQKVRAYHQETHPYQKLPEENKVEQTHKRKQEEMPPSRPFDPNHITLNGQTFRKITQEIIPKPNRATIPNMLVSCFECQTVQSVEGTAPKFICCFCKTPNECVPSHGIIRCYNCKTKILYSKIAGNHTRCSKCKTINSIPQEAKGWTNPVAKPVFYPGNYGVNPYVGDVKAEELSQSENQYPTW